MKITLSIIKADIGSIGGHVKPSQKVIGRVKEFIENSDLITDCRIFHTGDDIGLLLSHPHGENNDKIHKLAWDAFMAGTEIAKEQGLYGAGQDLLTDSFSGNVKGAGPGVAEIEFEERPNEAGLCVQKGHLTEMVDLFDQPFWDSIRNKASEKASAIREQGFFGAAMLGMNELEYGGITERLEELEKKFKIRE